MRIIKNDKIVFVLFLGVVISVFIYFSISGFNTIFARENRVVELRRKSTYSRKINNEPVIDLINDDIYFLYDGTTVVLTSDNVSQFYDSSCVKRGTFCGMKIPCVDNANIEGYVKDELHNILKGKRKSNLKTVKNGGGSFEYIEDDYGPEFNRVSSEIIKILVKRIELLSSLEDGSCMIQGYVLGESTATDGSEVLTADSDIRTHSDTFGHMSEYDYRDDRYFAEYEQKMSELVSMSDSIVRISKKHMSGTDGKYKSKYIEIDDSQQMIYAWEDGEIWNSYRMSGAYTDYTVFGVFKIREKADNAWSPIAEKWMPYWMSFYYDTDQEAWYGIHELTWWTDETGERVYETSENIGKRKSAGCLRVDRGEAEELYDWSYVGMPVLIHP